MSSRVVDTVPSAVMGPEEWLGYIAELGGNGETALARCALRRFRHFYPDFPVGEGLVPAGMRGHAAQARA